MPTETHRTSSNLPAVEQQLLDYGLVIEKRMLQMLSYEEFDIKPGVKGQFFAPSIPRIGIAKWPETEVYCKINGGMNGTVRIKIRLNGLDPNFTGEQQDVSD